MLATNQVRLPLPDSGSHRKTVLRVVGLIGLLGLVFGIGVLSLRIGSLGVSTSDTWNAIVRFDSGNYSELVVRTLRLPRTVFAIVIGAGLGVAGSVAQAVTRNPLADPSILGVSSGATFAVVIAVYVFGLTSPAAYVWFAFAGALAASLLVILFASAGKGGSTPAKVALAGIVVSSMLGAWTTSLLLLDRQTMDVIRFWLAGSVAGRSFTVFWWIAPFIIAGSAVALFLGPYLNVLALGEETARALGMRTGWVRALSLCIVVIITGASVAIAGPIAFIGLAVPHVVRSCVGADYRWVLPYSMLSGALLLTGADVLGRVVARPGEVQVGIVTAIIGAPFLIVLARRETLMRRTS